MFFLNSYLFSFWIDWENIVFTKGWGFVFEDWFVINKVELVLLFDKHNGFKDFDGYTLTFRVG